MVEGKVIRMQFSHVHHSPPVIAHFCDKLRNSGITRKFQVHKGAEWTLWYFLFFFGRSCPLTWSKVSKLTLCLSCRVFILQRVEHFLWFDCRRDKERGVASTSQMYKCLCSLRRDNPSSDQKPPTFDSFGSLRFTQLAKLSTRLQARFANFHTSNYLKQPWPWWKNYFLKYLLTLAIVYHLSSFRLKYICRSNVDFKQIKNRAFFSNFAAIFQFRALYISLQ